MQVAPGRIAIETLGRVAKGGTDCTHHAAHHIVGVENDVPKLGKGSFHRGRIKRNFVGNPLVVNLGACGSQHDVFDPVGADPARGVATFHPQTPRGIAISHNAIAEGNQFFPGLRNLVSFFCKDFGVIPHQALDGGPVPDAIEFAIDGA